MSSQKKPSFNELQRIWYEKLSASGFEDIESHGSLALKSWHSHYFKLRHSPEQITETIQYYDKCQAFLNSYQFHNPIEKQVWELYCQGVSYRDISMQMQPICRGLKKYMVNYIINMLEEEMECAKKT